MKRILFTLPSLSIGGLEKSLVALANKLVEADYDVTVLTWNPNDDLREALDERVHFLYKAPNEHLGNHIPYIRHAFYDDDMWERRANPKQFYQYYVSGGKYDVEIAYLHDVKTVNIISGSTNKDSVKIVWIHFDFSKDSDVIKGIRDGSRSKEELFRIFSSFDRVVCVSRQAADAFKEVVGDTKNISVIYNLLPIEEIVKKAEEPPETALRKSQLNVVYVGRLVDKLKGIARLISVIRHLRYEGADISLTIIGGGKDESYLRDYVRELRLDDFVTFVGQTLNPYPYIKASDLLVCSSYEEGYNLTVAEALILQKPVLSTDCTGPNEILDYGKYGFVVESSEEGLHLGLKYLYDNAWMLDYYRKTAKERLAFFDENRILKEITDLF